MSLARHYLFHILKVQIVVLNMVLRASVILSKFNPVKISSEVNNEKIIL